MPKLTLEDFKWWVIGGLVSLLLLTAFLASCNAQEPTRWLVTSYCACEHCCGKTDGITASGHRVDYGIVACNWLPFGSVIHIKGLGYFVVMDRGARSLFGSKTNKIRHIDLYLPTHKEAKKWGKKHLEVKIIKIARR